MTDKRELIVKYKELISTQGRMPADLWREICRTFVVVEPSDEPDFVAKKRFLLNYVLEPSFENTIKLADVLIPGYNAYGVETDDSSESMIGYFSHNNSRVDYWMGLAYHPDPVCALVGAILNRMENREILIAIYGTPFVETLGIPIYRIRNREHHDAATVEYNELAKSFPRKMGCSLSGDSKRTFAHIWFKTLEDWTEFDKKVEEIIEKYVDMP